jgi:hypothetical protein
MEITQELEKPNRLNGPNKLNRRYKHVWLTPLFVMVMAIALPPLAHPAWDDLLTHVQPYITLQEEYSSNVDLTPTNERDDFITTISPGFRVSTLKRSPRTGEFRIPSSSEEEKYGVDLDLQVPIVFYARNTSDDYIGLLGNLDAWYTFDRRLTLRVRDYAIRSEEPREQDYTAGALPGEYILGTERRQRTTYFRNVLQPSAEYRFGRENLVSINYINNVYRNESDLYEDSTENYINPKLDYWFDIRNGISLEYGFTLGDFERSPDLTGHMIMGRYTYRFNPRTSVFADFTYYRRDFEFPGDDYDIYRPTAGFEHEFSRTLSARVQAGYFLQDPQRASKEDGPFYDILIRQLAQRTTYTLAFQGGYTEDYFSAENLGFTLYHRGIGTITHRPLERMTVGLSGSLEHADYVSDPGDRKDWIWGVWANASYQLVRWLSASLVGSYRQDDSNIDLNDYTEYRGMFQITARY